MNMTKLKSIREARGLTQKQVAEMAAISYDVYQSLELGRRIINKCNVETVLKICDALNCTPQELLE